MSIYSSADLIESFLKEQTVAERTSVHNFLAMFGMPMPITAKDRDLLLDSLHRLNALAKDSTHAQQQLQLLELIDMLKQYDKSQISDELAQILITLIEDLNAIVYGRVIATQPSLVPGLPQQITGQAYAQLLNSTFLLVALKQSQIKELGNSNGECYGFTMSMADSELSPYKNNNIRHIQFNKTIYQYQKNQADRNKDQGTIKRTRLTGIRFCPSIKAQANALYDIASEYIGFDLAVSLARRHATYISKQHDNKIRYADSNHGVFLFDTKEHFIAAYHLMYQYQIQASADNAYKTYAVSKMVEDKHKQLKQSSSFSGLIRTLLTGSKYSVSNSRSNWIIGLGAFNGIAVGALIGSLLLPGMGSVIGSIMGGALGFITGLIIDQMKYSGILRPYHLAREYLYDCTEYLKKYFNINRECDDVVDLVDIQPHPQSYTTMNQRGLAAPHSPRTPAATVLAPESSTTKESRLIPAQVEHKSIVNSTQPQPIIPI